MRIVFTGQRLTHFGGVVLLHLLFRQLRLRRLLHRGVRVRHRNARYSVAEMLLALLYPMMLGLGRLHTTALLRRNGVFQALTGLVVYPNPITLRRFLLRIAPKGLGKVRQVHDALLAVMSQRARPRTRVILDLDSAVLTVYGNQEQATVGYNPKKRGRPSYHPLLCFEALTRDCWHGELRAGDAHTAAGTEELLQAAFMKVPPTVREIWVRADKGFFDHAIVETIERHKGRFVIVARITRPIRERLATLPYTELTGGVEAAEFQYQPTRWRQPYRFVVIRRPVPEDPGERVQQLTLFTLGKYTYQVLVTNLTRQPVKVWRFYNRRAATKLTIKELKTDYPLGKIPTKYWAANELHFHLLLFACNLVNWF